jgi:AbiV family abortive infection protein
MADDERTERFFERVENASASPLGLKSRNSASVNLSGDHVLTLLQDAYGAFERRSYGTATFLAITALEETAKAELILYRRAEGEPTRRDPMRNHANKHGIAVRDTTFMGKLKGVLGTERCEALHKEADEGSFVPLREASIYVDVRDGEIVTPSAVIDFERARELLLLAIEAATDALVGYTSRSEEIWSPELDALFARVAESVRA